MTIIVPLFTKATLSLWQETEGRELIQHVLEVVSGIKRCTRKVIVTNHIEIAKKTKYFGLEVRSASVSTSPEEESFLPHRTIEALNALRYDVKLEDAMVIDFRNPLLTSALLEKAIERFYNKGRQNLISVKKTSDHPIQLARFKTIYDVNLLHFFEERRENERILSTLGMKGEHVAMYQITRPFSFRWVAAETLSACGSRIFKSGSEEHGSRFEFVDTQKPGWDPQQEACVFWVYENDFAARLIIDMRLFSDELKTVEVCGASFNAAFDSVVLVAYRDSGNSHIRLRSITPVKKRSGTIFLAGAATDGADCGPSQIDFKDLFYGIETRMNVERVSSAIYFLSEFLERSGEYHYRSPLEPCRALWRIDQNDQRVTDNRGQLMTGRQDFPDLFIQDGSFVMLNEESVRELLIGGTPANPEGYELSRLESIRIETPLDMMKYKAIREARQWREETFPGQHHEQGDGDE